VRDVIKLSEQAVKVTIPGELDVLRFIFNREGEQPRFDGDTIVRNIMRDPVRANANPSSPWPDALARDIVSVRKDDDTLSKLFRESSTVYRPLQRFFDKGDFVRELETVHTARSRAASSLSMLEASHKRLKKPHRYVVGIEQGLYNDRRDMIAALRRRPA